MVELNRGMVLGNYEGEAEKSGRHKKLKPSKLFSYHQIKIWMENEQERG